MTYIEPTPRGSLWRRAEVKPHNGTPTSKAAAESVSHEAADTQRAKILDALRVYGGLTDEQIGQTTGLDGNTVRPRRGELVAAGKVRDSGTTRLTVKGRKAVVWILC